MTRTDEHIVEHMNFDTIAFNKGFLRVDSYKKDEDLTLSFDELCSKISISSILTEMQAELMRYGYMFNKEALAYLSVMSEDELLDIADNLADYLADAFGGGTFVSLFGNFPTTVMNMSEIEMFIHQMFHYLSGGAYSPAMPSCDDQELVMLKDQYSQCLRDEYRMISVIDNHDLALLFKNILSAQQSLTSYDKIAVEYFCDNYNTLKGVALQDFIPEDVPFKETACLIYSKVDSVYPKTITDVLRYAAYLSHLDVSLPALPLTFEKSAYGKKYNARKSRYSTSYDTWMREHIQKERDAFNFCKFKRNQRRDILNKMEHIFAENTLKRGSAGFDEVLADMKKHLGKWIRLGEILHPGEYSSKYPMTNNAFVMCRNAGQYISTYNSRVEEARNANDLHALLKIYSERPGEFGRNLDQLLRNYSSKADDVINSFSKMLPSISTKMLYELNEHFAGRNTDMKCKERFVFIKGSRQTYNIPAVSKIDDSLLDTVKNMIVSELTLRYSKQDSLAGKTMVVDSSLYNVLLPSNMRSLNFAPGQIPRGSVLNFDANTNVIRCYVRWVDKHGIYDLDLSATMLDENFNYKGMISWNTHYKLPYAVFSGDVRHRVGNCAEYVDVHIPNALKEGIRYIVAAVNDFEGEGFVRKEAWGGIMARSSMAAKGGEVTWAPETITTGFRLASSCTNIVMTVIDLVERKMYVVDEDYNGIPVASTKTNRMSSIAKRYVSSIHAMTVASLLQLNFQSRGASVTIASHDSVLASKEENTRMKKELENLIEQYKTKLVLSTDSDKVASMSAALTGLEDKYKTLCNTEFVMYDDVASDYTKIFGYMF